MLGHRVMAPSTLGHVPAVVHLRPRPTAGQGARETLRRAWSLGAGPGSDRAGHRRRLDHLRGVRQGQARSRLRVHEEALLPPDPGHPGRHRRGPPRRMRRARPTPSRGAVRFIEELVARVRRAGATGRARHALRLGLLVERHHRHPERLDVGYTMGVRMVKSVVSAVSDRRVGLDPDRLHR